MSLNMPSKETWEEIGALCRGNPGSLVACKNLHQGGYMSVSELAPLLTRLGLFGNGLYILHKDFGGKNYEITVDLLLALQEDSLVCFPVLCGGERTGVLEYCLSKQS